VRDIKETEFLVQLHDFHYVTYKQFLILFFNIIVILTI